MIHRLALDLSWHDADIYSFLPIILSLVFFTIFWFTSKSEKIKLRFYKNTDPDKASVNHITFNRIVGFVAMGILPVSICLIYLPDYSFTDYGLKIIPETSGFTILWIFILTVLVVPIAYFSAKNPKNLVNYPQIRAKKWTKKTVIVNAAGWTLYLVGYEILFRGVLLIPLKDHLGVWTAIAVNIAMYAATHIPKGLNETIGAVPLGLVLCILTLYSGTLWIAIVVHVMMALTNSFTAFKFHPDMQYIKS